MINCKIVKIFRFNFMFLYLNLINIKTNLMLNIKDKKYHRIIKNIF